MKSLGSTLNAGNLQKMSETMDQLVNMEVQAEIMEGLMARNESL